MVDDCVQVWQPPQVQVTQEERPNQLEGAHPAHIIDKHAGAGHEGLEGKSAHLNPAVRQETMDLLKLARWELWASNSVFLALSAGEQD
jgi:hypothetical protein